MDPWAVRQALLTALEFMAFHIKNDGHATEEEIRKFDLLARVYAKEAALKLVKKC